MTTVALQSTPSNAYSNISTCSSVNFLGLSGRLIKNVATVAVDTSSSSLSFSMGKSSELLDATVLDTTTSQCASGTAELSNEEVPVSTISEKRLSKSTGSLVTRCAASTLHQTNEESQATNLPRRASHQERPGYYRGIPGFCYVTSFCFRELLQLHGRNSGRHEQHHTFFKTSLDLHNTSTSKVTVEGDVPPHSEKGCRSASSHSNGEHLLDRLSKKMLPFIAMQNEEYFYKCYFPEVVFRLQLTFRCSASAPAVAIIYLERLLSCPGASRVPQNVIPILYGVLLTIATKFVDDLQHTNAYYASLLGMNLNWFNELERDVLNRLNYRLFVHESLFLPLQKIFGMLRETEVKEPVLNGRNLEQQVTCGTTLQNNERRRSPRGGDVIRVYSWGTFSKSYPDDVRYSRVSPP